MNSLRSFAIRPSFYIFGPVILFTVFATLTWAAPLAYVLNEGSNSVSVIDSATNTVTGATFAVGQDPAGIAITPDGAFLYVSDTATNTVSVVSTATGSITATVPVGHAPDEIAITPDGTTAYVLNAQDNTVSVIATASNTVVQNISVGTFPYSAAVTPDGAFLYVTSNAAGTVSIIKTASNTVVATVPLGAGSEPQGVAITPNGGLAYVAMDSGVVVIATATKTAIDFIPLPLNFGASGVAISPNGAYVYVSGNTSDIEVIATATNTKVTEILLPGDALVGGLAVSPNGAYLYATYPFYNEVAVIATATNTLLTTLPTGTGAYPALVTFAPSPAALSLTPAPASGLSTTFTLTYSDAYGASALKEVGVIFNSEAVAPNSCTVFYAPASNLLYLIDDAGTGSTSLTPGSGTLSNSQCSISGAGSSAAIAGNTLTLQVTVTASATFTGAHDVLMFAKDTYSAEYGWVKKGTWTPAANQPPAVVSVSPNPATGLSNTFALTYSDPNGATDLYTVGAIFNNSSSVTANSCIVFYAPAANVLYLVDDSGTTSSSITPGSGTLSNSQCTINGSGVSVTRSGDNLTLMLPVTASASYTSAMSVFLYAGDNSSANTGWVNEGSWTP